MMRKILFILAFLSVMILSVTSQAHVYTRVSFGLPFGTVSLSSFWRGAYFFPRYYPRIYREPIHPSVMNFYRSPIPNIMAQGETKRHVWLEARNEPEILISAPIPSEPTLEGSEIHTDSGSEI